MPNREEHCSRSLKQYGIEGREIHEWLDKPSEEYSGSHRQFRHDSETVKLVGEIFGKKYGRELAENIALEHIMVDHQEEIKKRNSVLVDCPKCGTRREKGNNICRYCGYSSSSSSQVFENEIKLRNNIEVTVREIDDSSLPVALPPLHIGGGYTKTVVDDIYSDLPNLEEVEKHFLRIGYGTYTVEALRQKGLSDNDIKKLIIESKKVTRVQIKELLTRQPISSQPQKVNIHSRILRSYLMSIVISFLISIVFPNLFIVTLALLCIAIIVIGAQSIHNDWKKFKKLQSDIDVAFGTPPRLNKKKKS